MGLKGSVKAFSLDQTLKFLSASSHQGSLHIFQGETRRTLYLYKGGLYFEVSTWSFRLGDALVRAGKVSPDQVEEALEVQRSSEGRLLGDCLVELGYTTEEEILAARRLQTEEEIYRLFGLEDAFFEFEKDVLPPEFLERVGEPEEFRFEVGNVLMEAARRIDEWAKIQSLLPSPKRLYLMSRTDGARKRVERELAEAKARAQPDELFNGRTTLEDMPKALGLSSFETQALVARLLEQGDVRPLYRGELESRFRDALADDLDYAVRLYECALETPEFDARGRILDRVFFGSPKIKEAAERGEVSFGARLRGKRAFQLLLALFRQGLPCEFTATEEGRSLRLGFDATSLVWRVEEGETPPSIVKHLLARSPVSASDLVRVREMQAETGRTLQQLLVGGGYVTMDNWFRAQKDTVLAEMIHLFFLRRPHVEVRSGAGRVTARPGVDIDVPLLPWLHAEVSKEIRQWEAITGLIPSVRAFLVLTEKGRRELRGDDDPFRYFDGEHSLEEVFKLTEGLSPQEFLLEVHDRLDKGRLKALEPEEMRERLEAMLAAGQRTEAINCCLAAIESHVDVSYFEGRLQELRAAEAEVKAQGTRATLRGDLASFSLAEVMQTLSVGKRSGTLRVEAHSEQESNSRQIYFDRGDIYLLSGEMEEEIDEADLEAGLVAAGLVSMEELSAAAAQQMMDEVYEMFLWEGAEFEFTADHLPPEFYQTRANRKILLNTNSFLLGAVRRIAEWEEVRKTLPSDDLVLAFDSNATKMQAVREKGNEDLLVIVDGRHAITDLVRMSRIRRFRALTLLAELVNEGALKIVDLDQIHEEDEDALFATDLPTSGVIEEGFVGQMQFVGTVQDWASAKLTGVMRVTDGRRSKELALVDGVLYRTQRYVPASRPAAGEAATEKVLSPEAQRLAELEALDFATVPEEQRPRLEMELKMLRMAVAMEEEEEAAAATPSSTRARLEELEALDFSSLDEEERRRKETELMLLRAAVEQEEEERARAEREAASKEAAVDSARDVAECFSWRGCRFELLVGTLHPRLEDPQQRDELRLDTETFFDTFAEAGEQWVRVGENVPKDKVVVWASEDAPESARELAGELPELCDYVGEERTPEDIARVSGHRFEALTWLAHLFERGLVVGEDPTPAEGEAEEDWDFSL
ncbi:MAG: DUF4388 domain-containing protein [Planctomycetota bacterium]|nr:MAG: DUF4388 domain-containing protein [Planctomycetota bacterium]